MGESSRAEILPGTLELLILKVVARGPAHGYGIADSIRHASVSVLEVGESSLYPALQRLLVKGWVRADWGVSGNNRRARYYTITPEGRKQLANERRDFDRVIAAIYRVLEAQ